MTTLGEAPLRRAVQPEDVSECRPTVCASLRLGDVAEPLASASRVGCHRLELPGVASGLVGCDESTGPATGACPGGLWGDQVEATPRVLQRRGGVATVRHERWIEFMPLSRSLSSESSLSVSRADHLWPGHDPWRGLMMIVLVWRQINDNFTTFLTAVDSTNCGTNTTPPACQHQSPWYAAAFGRERSK